jgi:hypothetical protein
LFALVNLVGGALGGWARHRDLSAALRRRRTPRELAHAMDALYRAEAAWKRGRADAVAVLEQATRDSRGNGSAHRDDVTHGVPSRYPARLNDRTRALRRRRAHFVHRTNP